MKVANCEQVDINISLDRGTRRSTTAVAINRGWSFFITFQKRNDVNGRVGLPLCECSQAETNANKCICT